MKVHGLELETGTVIKNANIRSGSMFPDDEFGDEITTKGQLFFKSDEDTLYVRNDANNAWISVGQDALEGLSDVDLTGLADGQSIAFDEASGKWMPISIVEPTQKYLNDLADVDVSNSTTNGWVLTYNAMNQQWEGLETGVGSISIMVDNMDIDGTFTHDNGANDIVTIDLNSENIPFEDDMSPPDFTSDNVRDAIIEVKEIAESPISVQEIAFPGLNGTGTNNIDLDEGDLITADVSGGSGAFRTFNFHSVSGRTGIRWDMHLNNTDGVNVVFNFDGTDTDIKQLGDDFTAAGLYTISFIKSSLWVSVLAVSPAP